MTASRVRWVDVFKGILILLVIFGHAVQGVAADATLATSAQHDSIKLAKDFVYSFHMPAFFVASGFFAGGLYAKNMRTQLAKRMRRLVVPYFVWGLITACAMQLMSSHTNAHKGLTDFLYSPIVPFSQLWYLYVLFFISLLHMGLSMVLQKQADRVLLGLGIVLYCAQSVMPNVWIMHYLCQYTMYYALGMFAFRAMNEHVDDARRWWLTAAGVLVLVASFVLLRQWLGARDLPWLLCSAFIALVGTFVVYCSSVWERGASARVWRGLAWCGQESLALYVSHLLVVQGMRIVLVRLLGVANLWLVVLVATVVGTAICCGGIALLKRTPVYGILF